MASDEEFQQRQINMSEGIAPEEDQRVVSPWLDLTVVTDLT
jgi:hypothetical protein